MARKLVMKESRLKGDEELVRSILEKIRSVGYLPEKKLYRGVPVDTEKLSQILKKGTDRLNENESHDLDYLFEEYTEKLSDDRPVRTLEEEKEEKKHHREYNDRNTFFAYELDDLMETFRYAFRTTDSEPIPALLIYAKDEVRKIQMFQYEFIHSPQRALKLVLVMCEEESKRSRVKNR